MLKLLLVGLLLSLPILTQAQSSEDQSSGGCGSSKDGWDVKTVKDHPVAPKPQDGKALVIVVQTMWEQPGLVIGSDKATTRIGVDGTWIGANHGDSYFFFAVDPGEHSICTDWQSTFYVRSGLASAVDLNAEAGATYYFRVKVRDTTNYREGEVKIEPIDKAEAGLLIGRSSFSTSHAKK